MITKYALDHSLLAVSCGHSNGGCSHFCTVSLSSIPVCSCPHGLVLGQDGYTCFSKQ